MSVVEKKGGSRLRQACPANESAFPPTAAGRLIISPPGQGALNMSIDDALLASATPELGPTLRFYRWSEPTLSLGYFQTIADRSEHAASGQLPLVRRASGGGAIVHENELTYSLVLPSADKSIRGADASIYRSVHRAFIDCLDDFGVSAQRFGDCVVDRDFSESFLCFQRRNVEDLVISGYKVLGSAQRRGQTGLLQHGSLLLASSNAAPELPGIRELTSQAIDVDRLIEQLSVKLAAACRVSWTLADLTIGEVSASKSILEEKYSSMKWIAKR